MGLVKSEYRAGVYDAQHFKDHTLDGDERRQREQAAAQQVLLQAIQCYVHVFGTWANAHTRGQLITKRAADGARSWTETQETGPQLPC